MRIHFTCPEGHKLTAKAELAGKLGKCPGCDRVVVVPKPVNLEEVLANRNEMTDSGVMRILGEVPPLPPAPEKPSGAHRTCPRCHKILNHTATICSGCQLYVGVQAATDQRPELGRN